MYLKKLSDEGKSCTFLYSFPIYIVRGGMRIVLECVMQLSHGFEKYNGQLTNLQ